jgi:cyanophycinase
MGWFFFFALNGLVMAQTPYDQRTTVGPDRGWLIIGGGGTLSNEVRDRFVALAGGQNASIVAIPTALADKDIDAARYGATIARAFGVSHVTVLHTRDRNTANSAAFVEPLKHATGVFLDGGRQWRLADAYLNTAVEREIKNLLARGGVVFGGSAGASIQASFLVRGDAGTPNNPDGDNTIMVSPGHEAGFGLLAHSAIDQHVDARDREADLDPVIAAHPELLGIGLYQDAAIIVHANSFFVISAPVLIHDGQQHGSRQYFTLTPGQAYDLERRATMTDDDAQQFPLNLILDRAFRKNDAGGTVTLGTGVIESRSATPLQAREIGVVCNTALYSAGAMPHPAQLADATHLSLLARDLNGNELHNAACQVTDVAAVMTDVASAMAAERVSAAQDQNDQSAASSGPPNMGCRGTPSPSWDNCVGAARYPNGNLYRGEFHHGMRDGFGVIIINAQGVSDQHNILANEPTIYAGEFRGNSLNGHGIWITKSGAAYSGTYRDNTPQSDVSQKNCSGPPSPAWTNCVGTVRYGNGNIYRGEFVNGQREGVGMIEIHDTGTPDDTHIRTPVPGVYVGEFQGNRLNGRGMIFMPGAGYYGTFKNNVLMPQSPTS